MLDEGDWELNLETQTEITTGHRTLVVGLGVSGLSAARWLHAQGHAVAVTDSRADPPGRSLLEAELPDVALFTGGFSRQALERAGLVVLSPGIPRDDPFIMEALDKGLPVVGDVELFARHVQVPVAAVTGANGKSTVATMLGMMAVRAGRDTRTGGNLGTPVLDMLSSPAELFVVELSSFQLESIESLDAAVGAVLNITPDHLDHHKDMDAYTAAKLRIWRGNGIVVANRDDPRVAAGVPAGRDVRWFGATSPRDASEYGLDTTGNLYRGGEMLLEREALHAPGGHNAMNALAALAMGDALRLPMEPMLDALMDFRGLPHRMEAVGEKRGVLWIDDSKATNVGAALAAISGHHGSLVVILGGVGKGQDFGPLADALSGRARHAVLLGRAADEIEQAIDGRIPTTAVADLDTAVTVAAGVARPGDVVLLSPACASFDMFRDYAARGRAFAAAVRGLET